MSPKPTTFLRPQGQRSSRVRGVSLVEALVALIIMALGSLAIAGIQYSLRQNASLSRQRAEAARLASQHIEELRYFASLDEWDEIVNATEEGALPDNRQNTTYTVQRTVTRLDDPPQRLYVTVTVRWQDVSANDAEDADAEGGEADAGGDSEESAESTNSVSLSTLIVAADPVLSGFLAARHATPVANQRNGRHRSIPPGAGDSDIDGHSRWSPPGSGGVRWIFNNSSGVLVSICAAGTAADASDTTCTTVSGYPLVVAGYVRFDGRDSPPEDVASQPTGPALALDSSAPFFLNNAFSYNLASGVNPTCYSAVPSAETVPVTVEYACLVRRASGSNGWGGRLDLTLNASGGIGTDTTPRRVCRYTRYKPDPDETPPAGYADWVPNADHPKTYCKVSSDSCSEPVTGHLLNQNFLVLRRQNAGDAAETACPSDTRSLDAAAGVLVTYHTRQHQPDPP